MTSRSLRCLMGLVALLASAPLQVNAQSPHVAGYVRHYQPVAPSAEAGRLLLAELNCVACHFDSPDTAGGIVGKPAPDLSQVGQRIHADWFESYLLAPHATKPGTTMPDLLATLDNSQRQEAAQALAALLASTGRVAVAPALDQRIDAGQQLFHTVGCAVCHQPIEGDTPQLATSTPLPQLDTKYTVPSLTQYLNDPLAVRAGGRMPRLGLSSEEAQSIASYLLRDIDVPASLTYRYYEGTWDTLPDFAELEPVREGQAVSFDLGVAPRRNNFGLVFDSFIVVSQPGEYTFYVGSDDGSRLLVGTAGKVAESDGIHPLQFGSGKLTLQPGTYPIQVQFFENAGGEELRVEWSGPNLPRQSIESFLVGDPDAALPPSDISVAENEALIAKGAAWYQKLNCNQCHSLEAVDKTQQPGESKSLVALTKSQGGCLTGAGNAPQYGLSDHQRKSLQLALAQLKDPNASTPDTLATVNSTLVQFNCIACHSRGELGGVEDERNAGFVTTQPEMGDEGRLPPPLTGIGSKLNPAWFAELLDKGANDRFYMLARMPGFGRDNVGHLIPQLAELDPLENPSVVETDEPQRRLKVAGHLLSGDKALGCIKCHVFADNKATGIQAISLTTMTRRLDQEWFETYMLDPNALRPGTRMPASFPKGKTYYRDLLDGTAETQIHALWTFLADGDKANLPDGLTQVGIELVADEAPRVYRNFIQGAGARAVGVGYPERVNLAFDADQLRIALLWQGRFIDASKHWTGRGQGYQGPLGVNRLAFPEGPQWTQLAAAQDAWPAAGDNANAGEFQGYRFNEKRQPAFLYSVEGVSIVDQPVPIQAVDFPSLRREFTLSSDSKTTLTMRAAVAPEITTAAPNEFVTSDGLTLSVDGDVKAYVDKQGNSQELRIEVPVSSAPLKWSLTYTW